MMLAPGARPYGTTGSSAAAMQDVMPRLAALPGTHAIEGAVETAESTREVLRLGVTCWRLKHADRFALIVDSERDFAVAKEAMQNARRSIIRVGWDFDLRISSRRKATAKGTRTRSGRFCALS